MDMNKFDIVAFIGEGGYGKVNLVKKFENNQTPYIMKTISLSSERGLDYAKREKEALLKLKDGCRFIVKLDCYFETKNEDYFIMEYCQGGDVYTRTLNTFPRSKIRLLIAEVVVALEYIHKNKIIHRDLKTNNILIGADGHVRIADFGCSISFKSDDKKCINNDSVGTLDYMSPEVVLGQEYSFEVDLWSLGIIMFELFYNKYPFTKQGDDEETRRNIVEKKLIFPNKIVGAPANLINKLLIKDPIRRLNTIYEIKEHEYFKNINWNDVKEGRTKAPVSLDVENLFDCKYFKIS